MKQVLRVKKECACDCRWFEGHVIRARCIDIHVQERFHRISIGREACGEKYERGPEQHCAGAPLCAATHKKLRQPKDQRRNEIGLLRKGDQQHEIYAAYYVMRPAALAVTVPGVHRQYQIEIR